MALSNYAYLGSLGGLTGITIGGSSVITTGNTVWYGENTYFSQGAITVAADRPVAKIEDEYGWLRRRVAETCWR